MNKHLEYLICEAANELDKSWSTTSLVIDIIFFVIFMTIVVILLEQ